MNKSSYKNLLYTRFQDFYTPWIHMSFDMGVTWISWSCSSPWRIQGYNFSNKMEVRSSKHPTSAQVTSTEAFPANHKRVHGTTETPGVKRQWILNCCLFPPKKRFFTFYNFYGWHIRYAVLIESSKNGCLYWNIYDLLFFFNTD